jgi:hypothetical protein
MAMRYSLPTNRETSMRKSWATYKREQRDRERERLRNRPDILQSLLKQPFNEYLPTDGNWNSVWYALEWAGIDPDAVPQFENDDDPGYFEEDDGPNRGAIGRAERMVGCLIDAASEMAAIINRYKKKEITERIQEIETLDMSEPDARKQAHVEIVRLKKMLGQLDKRVRWTFPEWKVTGE